MVLDGYPKEYIKEFWMKNGEKVLLRPIKPEDYSLEKEMFMNFSKKTEKFRFFKYVNKVTHEMLVRYTQINYNKEIAIIAELEEDGQKKMAGVVRLILDPYESAEFAIVIADPWQGNGLGGLMTDYILDIAKMREIKKVYALFLSNNYLMKYIFEKRGFKISRDRNVCKAELDLKI